jgi:hypothetical protein
MKIVNINEIKQAIIFDNNTDYSVGNKLIRTTYKPTEDDEMWIENNEECFIGEVLEDNDKETWFKMVDENNKFVTIAHKKKG